MTESEAKTKWCPFTRNGNEPGCNRSGNHFPMEFCIGSACMAWRVNPHGAEHGWCGLAGVPTP